MISRESGNDEPENENNESGEAEKPKAAGWDKLVPDWREVTIFPDGIEKYVRGLPNILGVEIDYERAVRNIRQFLKKNPAVGPGDIFSYIDSKSIEVLADPKGIRKKL